MAAIRDGIARGLRRMETLAGSEVCKIGGIANIPCVGSTLQRGVDIAIGGNLVRIDLTLYVRKEHFPTFDMEDVTFDDESITLDRAVPVAGTVVVFREESYLLVAVRAGGGNGHLELMCKDQNSGE